MPLATAITSRNRHALALTVAALTTLLWSRVATADVVEATWTSDQDFQYQIYHLPDFDQRRDDLPGNGSAYCVPTSAMNLLAYIGNHGYPGMNPGSGDWQLQSNYDWITTNLDVMGQLMGTSPSGGTGYGGELDGVDAWLPDEYFVARKMFASGGWTPRIQDIGAAAITGALVNFAYGRYDVVGSAGGIPIVDRTGGHAVTLSRIDVNPVTDWLLWCRNPNTKDDNTVQSLFSNNALQPRPYSCVVNGNLRQCTELETSDSSKVRLIDSYLTIRTRNGYSFESSGGTNSIGVISPFGNLAGAPTSIPLDLPPNRVIRDAVPLADGFGFATIAENPTTGVVFILIVHAGGPTAVPMDEVEVPEAKVMVVGDDRLLYVLRGNPDAAPYVVDKLEVLDPDDGLTSLREVSLPWKAQAVVYDDTRDLVHVLPVPGAGHEMVTYAKGLSAGPMLQPLPAGSIPGSPYVATCAADGTLYLVDQALGEIHRVSPDLGSFDAYQFGVFFDVEAVDADERGHLFIVNDGTLTELVPGAGGLAIDHASPWKGLSVGKYFSIDRSRTNFDPDNPEMVKLAENNVPDDPVEEAEWPVFEDCLADVNGDLMVDIDDLLAVLAVWGSNDALGDMAPDGGDGTVGIDDLLHLLARWGGCGP